MSLQDKLKTIIKALKITSVIGATGFFIHYQVTNTCNHVKKIMNSAVLEKEKKYVPEYIYIDDPSYGPRLKKAREDEKRHSIGFARIWKSLKHSLAWRLLWLCKHGNKTQRNIALEQLAAFKNSKDWDCLKLAQAMDKNTAVLLARTKGADLRYFLPPPIYIRRAALKQELLSFKLRDLILSVQTLHPHSCIQHFLSKKFMNIQDHALEVDSIPAKPESISERDLCILCLDALHHHITLFHNNSYEDDASIILLVKSGLLTTLSELILRNPDDPEIDFAVLRILTVLSVHCNLLESFFQTGLIRELSRLLRVKDVRLSSSAAVCLANLSGEHCYRPGLFLLHPLYRTTKSHSCDTLLVHGLRGGVFVTWRQRDRKCAEPLGLLEVTVADADCESCEVKDNVVNKFLDPDLQQVLEDILEIEDEALLSEYEVVLHDLPLQVKRESLKPYKYTSARKRLAMIQEAHDQCHYTYCWPKDWLPKDCSNLRILGVNYWSSLSEWLERCPLQTADIQTRAAELAPALVDAGVGKGQIPIVWLTHSMGGLIVKQVLIDAARCTDNLFKNVCDNTRAIFFYSTPHKGSALASMPRAAAAILWPSNDVKQLEKDSPFLLELQSEFIKLVDQYKWETISFAESKPTLITAFKVPVHFVESYSADLGRGEYYELPLDHLAICKPATRQSVLYTTVLDVLLRITSKDITLKYYNTYLAWMKEHIWWIFNQKVKEVIENIDETQGNDGLRWFEKFLLDTFTDGFTD